jgi:hypothetical protein
MASTAIVRGDPAPAGELPRTEAVGSSAALSEPALSDPALSEALSEPALLDPAPSGPASPAPALAELALAGLVLAGLALIEPAMPAPALAEAALVPAAASGGQGPTGVAMADLARAGFPLGNAAMLCGWAAGSLAAKATIVGWPGATRSRHPRSPVSRMPPSFSSKQRGDAVRALSRFFYRRCLGPY